MIIADRCERRGVGGESDGAQWLSLLLVARDELGDKMLAVGGGAAVATCKHGVARFESSSDDARPFLDRREDVLHTLCNHIDMAHKSTQKNRIFTLHTGRSIRTQPTPKKPRMKASQAEVVSFSKVRQIVKNAKAAGLRVVTTCGSFDILHTGHVRYLAFSRRQGDILIVGINSDSSVRRNKGAGRPLTRAHERAGLVAALRSVDAVFIYSGLEPMRWLKILKPHVHVKGADRTMAQIVERAAVESVGGKVVRAPYLKNRSTTSIITKIRLGRL